MKEEYMIWFLLLFVLPTLLKINTEHKKITILKRKIIFQTSVLLIFRDVLTGSEDENLFVNFCWLVPFRPFVFLVGKKGYPADFG